MKRADPRREGGFSLVETVAAIGILSIAALPLMQVSREATRNTGRLEARLLARTVAENVMARTLTDPDVRDAGIEIGTETQLQRTFHWTLTTGPAVPGDVQTIEVAVSIGDDEQVLARLQSLKLGPTLVTADSAEATPSDETGEP